MQFRDVDRESAEGRAALAAFAATHGAALSDAARDLDRLFLIGSPWAPGLWFVGGQTARAPFGAAGVFNVAGAGLTFSDALASCAGEASERVGQIERAGDITKTATLAHAVGLSDATRAVAEALLRRHGGTAEAPLDWITGRALASKRLVDVPADWVLRRAQAGPLHWPGSALSTGAAAGPTAAFASQRAVLELVERDAASLWWHAGRPAQTLALDAPSLSAAAACLTALRRDHKTRLTRLLDITTDVGIPVVAALSTDLDGGAFAVGFGCRTTRAAAAVAAVMELAQTETGLQLSMLKREQMGVAALSHGDQQHLARAAQTRVDRMATFEAPVRPDLLTETADIATIAEHMSVRGIEVTAVLFARAGLPVVKAVAVALQQLPGEIETIRSIRAQREFGGASHWNDGVALF